MAKTPHSQCRGQGFDAGGRGLMPGPGTKIPPACMVQPRKYINKPRKGWPRSG